MHKRKWFEISIASLLLPTFITMTSIRVIANPEAVKINSVNNNKEERDEYNKITFGELGYADSSSNENELEGQRIVRIEQFLWIPNNNSYATVSYVNNNQEDVGFSIHSTLENSATFHFPCGSEGGTNVIGWFGGGPRDGGATCANQGFEIDSTENSIFSKIFSEPVTQKSLFFPQKFISQEPRYSNSLIHYCTVAAKDKGWWISRGTISRTTISTPCREAYKQCFVSGATEESCKVVSQGNWRVRDKDLLVNISCEDNRNYQRRGNGREITDNLLIFKAGAEARANSSEICVLNVYKPSSLIVSPASKKATLIQTHSDNRSRTIVVEALAGDVIIRSAQNPEGFVLRVGNRYVYPSDTFESIDVSQIVNNSSAVQNFLEPNNWFPGAENQLDQYRANLDQSVDQPSFFEQTAPILIPLLMNELIEAFSEDDDSNSPNIIDKGNNNEQGESPIQ